MRSHMTMDQDALDRLDGHAFAASPAHRYTFHAHAVRRMWPIRDQRPGYGNPAKNHRADIRWRLRVMREYRARLIPEKGTASC